MSQCGGVYFQRVDDLVGGGHDVCGVLDDIPDKGDPGTTSVSVKRLDNNTIEETDKRDGKVIGIYRMTVAPDGKTMTIAITDKLRGTSSEHAAEKQ